MNSPLRSNRLKKKILLAISIILIATGLTFLFFYFYWYFTGEKIIQVELPINLGIGLENSAVVEEVVSEAVIREYNVPTDQPRYLTVADLGIHKTRILSVGLDKDGHIDTPVNIFDTAWFKQSGKPGEAGRVMFIDGHNGGPTKDGVFKHLPSLKVGAIVEVERGDGEVFRYQVTENYIQPLDEFDNLKMQQILTSNQNQEILAIISCTGKWIQARRAYTDRVVVRAVRLK